MIDFCLLQIPLSLYEYILQCAFKNSLFIFNTQEIVSLLKNNGTWYKKECFWDKSCQIQQIKIVYPLEFEFQIDNKFFLI